MSISFSNALGIHEQALLLRGKRTEILASNIANVDTPGYKARDLDFAAVLARRIELEKGFGQGFRQGFDKGLETSDPMHLRGFTETAGINEVSYRVSTQPSADGNTVDEQLENAMFARNALEHQASFEFLNRKFKGLIKAIRGE